MSARKEAQGCKLILDGFWSYICPDLFAFCQWLFLGQDVPDGLIPEGYIYNHYYDGMDIKETCCLRYPHLSDCEHGIRKVMQSEECKEWFIGTDTIVSSHDLISKALQADWDGDHICLVHDEAFLRVLDRKKKDIIWNCYGDILYDNICKNVDDGFILKIRRNIYQSSKKREKQIATSRDKVKKEQEDIVKIPITQTLYDYFMDATTRGGCENDKYILYIIYVLIERYKKKYGSENEYVRIYKGLKQKGKITPATIDKWFGGKITAKALDRLEKYKYIKREQRERYDKIYLCDIPTEEASEAQFMAESFNPLLDLWESNGDRKVGKCEICGKKFVVVGNSKTCSVKCSKILVKKNKNKQ